MNYDEILEEIEKYFCDLLIIQYRQAPKNRALIKALVNLIFAKNLGLKIKDLTVNLKDSIGAQLDVVGKWLGVDRNYSGEFFEEPRLALVGYNQIKTDAYFPMQGGFSNYTNFDALNGGFLMYKEWYDTFSAINKLGDIYFRRLCELKAIKNSIVFTNKNIDDAINKWSNGEVYTTWDVMQVTYHYPVSYYQIMNIAYNKNVLLAPTGCEIILEEYI